MLFLGPRRRSLVAVLVSTLGLGLSYGLGYTLTSVRFEDWGAPGWLVGLAAAMPALAVLAVIPFAPRLATRIGTVPAMLLGAALVATSFALMPVLESPGWWLALRFLAGAGLALPWLAGETWINTVSEDAVRGRVLATYTVLLFGGWAAGPQLVDVLGADGTAPFALGVLAMILCAAPLVAGRRLAPPIHGTGRFAPRAAVALAPIAIGAAFVGGIAEFGYLSLLPSYAAAAGLDEGTALRLLTVLIVGGITLQFGIGWLADRVDRRRLLGVLAGTLAAAAATLAVLVDAGPAAYVATFVLGGVVMGFYAVGLAVLGERVPVQRLALANAAFLMAYESGAVVGPVAGGAAMDLWEPHGVAVAIGLAGVAFAVVALRGAGAAGRERRARTAAPRDASARRAAPAR